MPKKPDFRDRNNSGDNSSEEAAFGSNEVRLSGWQWITVAIIIAAVFILAPAIWEGLEKFKPDTDYRIPYKLGNDYWFFKRYCQNVNRQDRTLVLGDSVIWGHYVKKDQTLSAYLNQLSGSDRFVNMGVDGIHPIALAGLVDYYAKSISGKNIIIHYNPLWMSSLKHDLQVEKEFRFNHPMLVPQFFPNIACYKESYSNRIGIVLERFIPYLSWVSHLRIAYFDTMDIGSWTIENPYSNPLKQIRANKLSGSKSIEEPLSWRQRGIEQHQFEWVEPAKSLQWRFFKRTVKILLSRKNKVVVLIGPFNEHMVTEESLASYIRIKHEIETYLRKENIPYLFAEELASELYADASHPLAEGYAMIAKQLLDSGLLK